MSKLVFVDESKAIHKAMRLRRIIETFAHMEIHEAALRMWMVGWRHG